MAREGRLRAVETRVKRLKVPKQVADAFGPYKNDPAGFVRDILGAESATRRSDGSPYQLAVLSDLALNPRVSVRTGHGTGKSALCAWALLWWLLTRPGSRVIVVAPQFTRQVRGIFSETRRWARRARVRLPVQVLGHRVLVDGHGEEWAAIGVPATEPDRIEGFHAEGGLLLVLDECKGIGQDVFDALQGALTGGEDSRLLVTSTPGGIQGPFHRLWTRGSAAWALHHLSSEDSSLVAPGWVADRAAEWGVGSPLYEARVRGNFADAGEGVLFPLSLLEAASAPRPAPTATEERHLLLGVTQEPERVLGVDVSRSLAGDWNCVALAIGQRLESLTLWRSTDLMVTVRKVAELAVLTSAKRVRVDVGGVGAGVVDRLKQLDFWVEAVAFGGGATEPQRFRNRRAEMFFALRERLEAGAALPDDDDLLADLSALRYTFDQSGRILLESKDDMRKRIGRSPDRADAVALALGVSTRAVGVWHQHTFRVS